MIVFSWIWIPDGIYGLSLYEESDKLVCICHTERNGIVLPASQGLALSSMLQTYNFSSVKYVNRQLSLCQHVKLSRSQIFFFL